MKIRLTAKSRMKIATVASCRHFQLINQCFFILENANITINQRHLGEEIHKKEDKTQRKNLKNVPYLQPGMYEY